MLHPPIAPDEFNHLLTVMLAAITPCQFNIFQVLLETDRVTDLPTSAGWLAYWQLFVATTAVFNTIQNFVTVKLTRKLYNNVPPNTSTSSSGSATRHRLILHPSHCAPSAYIRCMDSDVCCHSILCCIQYQHQSVSIFSSSQYTHLLTGFTCSVCMTWHSSHTLLPSVTFHPRFSFSARQRRDLYCPP